MPGPTTSPDPVGLDSRPGDREAIRSDAELRDQVEVRLESIVMIAGDPSIGAVRDDAGKTAESSQIEAPLPSAVEAPSIWNALLATSPIRNLAGKRLQSSSRALRCSFMTFVMFLKLSVLVVPSNAAAPAGRCDSSTHGSRVRRGEHRSAADVRRRAEELACADRSPSSPIDWPHAGQRR